jgi:hypothetical protein
VLALLAVLSLTACDPPPRTTVPADVWLSVYIGKAGGAEATAFVEGDALPGLSARAIGDKLATLLFPEAESREVSVSDSLGDVTVRFGGVYDPGTEPRVSVDTRDAVTWLLRAGARTVDVSVGTPRVPSTATWTPDPGWDRAPNHWGWNYVTSSEAAPHGEVVMRPEAWRGLLLVAVSATSFALLAGSLVFAVRRRWRAAVVLAASGTVIGFIAFVDGDRYNVEQLGVSGLVSQSWLELLINFLILAALASAFGGIPLVAAFALAAWPRRPPVFLAPPGWPEPPTGWLPTPGWTPNPDWPPAPPDWTWYRRGRRSDPRP